LLREAGRHVFFRAGSSVLLCFIADATRKEQQLPSHGAAGEQHFALEVEARFYESCKKEIESKGIIIEHEQTWKHNLRSFYFRDPDRHLVEIIEAGAWG
jgi:catechol 2,3-dioxygenase-like lactoylglutathione lyase family enzyme